MATQRSKKQYLVRRRKLWRRNKIVIFGSVVLLALVLFVLLELTGITHFLGEDGSYYGGSYTPSESSQSQQMENSSSSPGTSSEPTNAKSAGTGSSSPVSPGTGGGYSGVLIAPYGRFVSQHTPGSSSVKEQSACITSSGATCTIIFSKGGKKISLKPTVADGSGSAYWSWTPKEYGLTSGLWTITAKASANGSSKSTVDPNGKLVIP